MLEQLKATDPELYALVSPRFQDGNLTLPSLEVAHRLDAWLVKQAEKRPEYRDDFNERMAALAQSEHKRLRTERDQREAEARLGFWQSQGLEDTHQNAQTITDWLTKNVKGYPSGPGIDVAVECEGPRGTNRLTWRKSEPVAPISLRPPAEPVRLLPNGQPELPLNASEAKMRAASKEQLQDLSRRRGEGRQPHLGSFSSRF
jgi:hypothetical protein